MTRLVNVVKPKFSGANKWGYGIKIQDDGESAKFNMILTNDKLANPIGYAREIEDSEFGH